MSFSVSLRSVYASLFSYCIDSWSFWESHASASSFCIDFRACWVCLGLFKSLLVCLCGHFMFISVTFCCLTVKIFSSFLWKCLKQQILHLTFICWHVGWTNRLLIWTSVCLSRFIIIIIIKTSWLVFFVFLSLSSLFQTLSWVSHFYQTVFDIIIAMKQKHNDTINLTKYCFSWSI